MTSEVGLCECGCGRPAPLSSYNDPSRGYVKGMPRRFVHGHNRPKRPKIPPETRFWAKVKRGGSDECWPWFGATRGFGHGCLWIDGRMVVASRYSYELHNGPIPDGLFVLHRCDNPPCVNPAHLFLGDQAVNLRDMVAKGRSLFGERHSLAKLTDADVRSIRLRATGRRGEATEFAAEYGVTVTNICYVLKGATWKHVA